MAVTPATAAPVTFSFTGSVGNVTGPVGNLFPTLGTGAMNGTITFSLPPAPPNIPGAYFSPSPITGLTLTIPSGLGTYTAIQNTNPTSAVGIFNNSPGDGFVATSSMSQVNNSPIGAGNALPFNFYMEFLDSSGNVFSNQDLVTSLNIMTTPPGLGSFNSNLWRLEFTDGNRVTGSFSSFTAPVPLPPAVILFGAGIVALIGLGARNWRREAGARLA